MHRSLAVLLTTAALACSALAQSPKAASPAQQPATSTVEYYYKLKWGYQDEFLKLFNKNHLPVLKKQMEMGRIVSVSMVAPELHMTEDARWDYRVTIVFNKQATAAPFDEDALKKQLFPDQATYSKEEQRRFEILLAHWDLPLTNVNLDKP